MRIPAPPLTYLTLALALVAMSALASYAVAEQPDDMGNALTIDRFDGTGDGLAADQWRGPAGPTDPDGRCGPCGPTDPDGSRAPGDPIDPNGHALRFELPDVQLPPTA